MGGVETSAITKVVIEINIFFSGEEEKRRNRIGGGGIYY